MKKFKFYALAFAAIAFAGCSDDVIDGKGGNNGMQGDGTPAYLTISFSANGNSSRAADNNAGDYDGDAEDSDHESAGVAEESAVKTALLVVSPVTSGSTGFAKTYTISSTPDAQNDFHLVDAATDYYTLANPIQVTAGETYRVLVVLNPPTSLTTQVTGGQIDNTDNAVETLYNNIITGQYSYTGTTTYADNYINAANSIGMGLAFSGENNPKTDAAFMMANKEAVEVTPDVNDTETNPCVAEVEVERALSKITFRTTNNNIYPVELSTGTVPAETERGAYDPAGGTTYQAATFNKATLNHDNTTEVYALYDASNEFVGVYQKSATETTTVGEESNLPIFTRLTPHTAEAYENLEDKSNAYIASGAADDTDITLAEEAASFTLVIDEDAVTENTTWYVRLEGYALVNLAKEVNYVRHTVSANGGLETPFGTLNGTNYLWTPYFEAKNALDVTTDFSESINTNWYYNTLADVSTESETLVIGGTADNPTFTKTGESGSVAAEYYKPMSLITDGSTVTGTGDQQHTTLPNSGNAGNLMAYCFENSTDETHQTHGLSTCISFVARIYSDENCSTAIDNLYSYNGFLFTSLQQLVDAFDGKVSDEIKTLAIKETNGNEVTRAEAEAAGVLKYQGNTCYYYTTEIKHFDNKDNNTLGNMEFAIMRNNIYSLAVTGIENIGTPFVDPTPNTPDESSQAYLNVQVNILPWIVRYNDIEF